MKNDIIFSIFKITVLWGVEELALISPAPPDTQRTQ